MRGPLDPSTLLLAALAMVLAVVAYAKDPGLPLIVAGMTQVLVPQEVVSRHFGHQAGIRALVIATIAGMPTPGGPMVSVPFIAWEAPLMGWKFVVTRVAWWPFPCSPAGWSPRSTGSE
jgi:hypothetical protein